MKIDLIWIIAGLVGAGGLGYIALIFLLPTLALTIEQFVLKLLGTKVGLVIVALAAGLLFGDLYRHAIDKRVCAAKLVSLNTAWQKQVDEAADEFKAARETRDAEVAQQLATANEQREKDLKAQEQDWQTRLKQFEANLKPSNECGVITPEDLK